MSFCLGACHLKDVKTKKTALSSSRGLSKILFKLATMCPTDAYSNDRSGPHTDKYMPTRLRAHLGSTIIKQQSAGTGKTKPGQKSVADGIC